MEISLKKSTINFSINITTKCDLKFHNIINFTSMKKRKIYQFSWTYQEGDLEK